MSQNNKDYTTLNIAAAFTISGLIYMGNFVSPVMALISAEYPAIDASLIKMLTTIPSLMMVVMSLVSGSLTNRFPIKKIVLFACSFSLVGGMIPVFFKSFNALLISRFIFGIGHGMIFPMASAIVNSLFTGERRDKLMGIRAGIGTLIGATFSTVAGIIGSTGWRNSIACTAIVIPMALFIAWKCPENEVAPKASPSADAASGKEKKFTGKTWMLYAVLFIYNMFMVTFMMNLALVIAGDGIGTTAQAGTINSTFTVASFLAGLMFGSVKKKIRRFISPLAFGLVGLAFCLMFFANNIALFYVGAVIYGFGFGFYNPALTVVAAQSAASPKYASIAIAGYTSIVGLGQFLAPIVLKKVAAILGLTGLRTDWNIAFIGCFAVMIGAIIYIMCTGGIDGKKAET